MVRMTYNIFQHNVLNPFNVYANGMYDSHYLRNIVDTAMRSGTSLTSVSNEENGKEFTLEQKTSVRVRFSI